MAGDKRQEGEQKIPIGVIGAVKDFQVYFLPEVNSEIDHSKLRFYIRVANATIVNGKVNVNDRFAAECELKIFTSEQVLETMKKAEVPQDNEGLLEGKLREVCYAVDESGNYVTVLSTGWTPKNAALKAGMGRGK